MRKLGIFDKPCMYCGEKMQQSYDDYTPYYECNCPDARKHREVVQKIQDETARLNKELPPIKYEILTSKNENHRFLRKLDRPIVDSFL